MKNERNAQYSLYVFLLCFYTFFRIFSSSYLTDFINVSFFESIVNYFCCFGLFVVFLLQNKIKVSKLFISIFVFFVILLASYYSSDKSIIVTCLFIIAFPKGLSLKRIGIPLYRVYFSVVILIIICSFVGVIPDYISYQHGVSRHSLGFVSPNSVANIITLGILLWNLFSDKKKTFRTEKFLILTVFITYFLTNSRLAFIIGLLDIFVFILLDSKKLVLKNIVFIIAKYIMILFSFFCIFATIAFSNNSNSKLYNKLDSIVTGRLNWMVHYYKTYGFDFFGNRIFVVSKKTSVETGASWRNLDNSYVLFCIKYGFLFLIVFLLLYFFLGNYLKRTHNYRYAIYVILLSIFGLTENILFTTGFNFSLIMIAEMVSDPKKID